MCFTGIVPVVDPTEPYTNPPTVWAPEVRVDWDGTLEIIDRIGVLQGVRIVNELPLGECLELHLIDCELHNVSFSQTPGIEVHLERAALTTCDLSHARLRTISKSTITGGKLVGTDLSSSEIADVTMSGSTFRYLSLRMAELTRVAFIDNDIDDIDLYDSELTDVSFGKSRLTDVRIDQCKLDRVDFRDTERLGLTSINNMKGALISESQVLELAFSFAMSSGIGIYAPHAG